MREGPISGLRFAGSSRRFWPDSGEARRSPGEVDAMELQTIELLFLFLFLFPSRIYLCLSLSLSHFGVL